MASLKVFSTQRDPGTDLLNDYSLLTEVSSDSSLNKDANQSINGKFNFTNMQSALTAGILPDSSVEVHSQINQLLEENNQLKEMLNKNNSMLEENLKKAKEKIYSLENENSALHENIDDLERKEVQKKKSCIQQFASLQTDEETGFEVVRLKPCEDTVMIEELKKEVKEKDEEMNCLLKENENLLKKLEEYESKIQECKAVLNSQNKLLNSKLENATSVSQQYQESCKNLEQQIKELKPKLEEDSRRKSDDQHVQQLQEEIQTLKEMLKLEQQTNKKNKEKLSEIMNKCENLQVDYDRVTKILEIQSKDEKTNLALKEIDAKRYMEENDHLLAKLIDFQEQLDEKNAVIRELQSHHKEQKSHSTRNQGSRFHQKDQNAEATGIILCPICSKGFTDEYAAQNHAIRCLEENNQ